MKLSKKVVYIFFIIFISLILKLTRIFDSLTGDEVQTILDAGRNLKFVFTKFTGNNHQFYSLLIFVFIKLFGENEFTVRFPSLIISFLSIYFLFKLSVEFIKDKKILFLLLLFYSISPSHVHYSYLARGYITANFFVILSFIYFLKLKEHPCLKNSILLSLFSSLAFFTHFAYIIFILAEILAFILLKFVDKKKFSDYEVKYYYIIVFLFTELFSFILYYPSLNTLLKFILNMRLHHIPLVFADLYFNILQNLKSAFTGYSVSLPFIFYIPLIIVMIYSILKLKDRRILYFLPFIFSPWIALILTPSTYGKFPPRFFYYIQIFILILFFYSLEIFKNKKILLWSFVVYVFLLSGYGLYEEIRNPIQDLRGGARYIEENLKPGDIVICLGSAYRLKYYVNPNLIKKESWKRIRKSFRNRNAFIIQIVGDNVIKSHKNWKEIYDLVKFKSPSFLSNSKVPIKVWKIRVE